jgi:hypothetical protein
MLPPKTAGATSLRHPVERLKLMLSSVYPILRPPVSSWTRQSELNSFVAFSYGVIGISLLSRGEQCTDTGESGNMGFTDSRDSCPPDGGTEGRLSCFEVGV